MNPETSFREFRASMARMERVLAATPSGLAWLDAEGRVKWCNEAFAQLSGRERLFMLGQEIQDLWTVWREGRPLEPRSHPALRAVSERRDVDEIVETAPGAGRRLMRVNGRFVRPAEEEPFFVLVVADVTDAVQREAAERMVEERTKELRAAVAEYETFAYSVAHDLRAPLRSVHGFGQILLKRFGAQLPEPARELLDHILQAGQRMDRLVLDLLAYSRLTREEVELAPLDLEALVDEVLAAMKDELEAGRAEVTVARPVPAVVAHAGILKQALTNLVANAAKFVRPGESAKISISAERRDDSVRLLVRDQGIGIEPRFHDRIFQVFQRLHRQEDYAGTGIGLAIVRRAAERLGAAVGMESEPGRGSLFWLDLPAAPGAE